MKRALYVFVFVLLVAEPAHIWHGVWTTTPAMLIGELYYGKFLGFQMIFSIVAGFFLASLSQRAGVVATPMMRALWLLIGSVGALMVLGVSNGGDVRQALFQAHMLVLAALFAMAASRFLRTPADFTVLGRVVLAAGVYRAVMCVLFYLLVIRSGHFEEPPETVTTHDDTVLWVVCLFILGLNVFETNTKSARRLAYWLAPLILVAIQFNNRRLAWVSLAGTSVALYFVFPPSELKRRLNRTLLKLSPLFLVYFLVGKAAIDSGVKSPIFKPLSAILSSSDKNNLSTKSRDAENMGLLVTFMPNMWFGTGLGLEYIEVDSTLSARDFLQYKYVPHNSTLGFVAFCGVLGFLGIWAVFPMSIMLNTRAYRRSSDPQTRTATAVSAAAGVVGMVQAYGDMGLFSQTTLFITAGAWACAARLTPVAEAEADLRAREARTMKVEEPSSEAA